MGRGGGGGEAAALRQGSAVRVLQSLLQKPSHFHLTAVAPYLVAVERCRGPSLSKQSFAACNTGACGPRGISARVTGTPAAFFATLLLMHAAPVSFGEMIS
jgi:hypothetical protein